MAKIKRLRADKKFVWKILQLFHCRCIRYIHIQCDMRIYTSIRLKIPLLSRNETKSVHTYIVNVRIFNGYNVHNTLSIMNFQSFH